MNPPEQLLNLEDNLKPYLRYSFAVHAAVLLIFLVLYRSASVKSTSVYMIDFVGPSAVILNNQTPQASGRNAPEAAKLQPQSTANEFQAKRRKKGAPLPRPSLLRGYKDTPAAANRPVPALAPAPSAASSGAPGEAGITTDLPNFPYPWYISQLRQSLWNQWAERMPKEKSECVVVFTLLPNGSVVDLRTEESSGDSAFDLIALSAVQDAAPYPPLPRGFKERFLKIHVNFKSL